MRIFRSLFSALIALSIGVLTSCASDNAPTQAAIEESIALEERLKDYRLGAADKVRIIVFGEPDLSGEFAVNARGQISLPLLGEVDAEGRTIEEVRQTIASGLSEGYVLSARVAAEVIEYRPYYILGEVNEPGEYPYSSGMSVIKAVAAASGFTYRVNKSAVYIERGDNGEEVKYKLTSQLMVLPGDVIRVGERFF